MMSGTEALGDGKPSPDSVIVGLAESNFDDDDGIMNAPTHLSSSSADGFPDQLMDGEDEDSVDGAEGFSADPGLEGERGFSLTSPAIREAKFASASRSATGTAWHDRTYRSRCSTG